MRTLAELLNTTEPAMPLIRTWMADAKCPVEILPCSAADGERALLDAQITTRSPMGAICHETGGILVDDGWLRILGAGCERLPRALMAWSRERVPFFGQQPSFLIIADDPIGGFFCLNGGAFTHVEPGHVAYFAPDTLEWEDLDMTYSDFLCWSWSGVLERFYGDQRWPDWRAEMKALRGDQTFCVYPFLWAEGPPIDERVRKAVPSAEMWHLSMKFREELGGASESPR
jgi:hypothetical protein